MIHHLNAGRWGYATRRLFESAVGNLPLMALLYLPIFFGPVAVLSLWILLVSRKDRRRSKGR